MPKVSLGKGGKGPKPNSPAVWVRTDGGMVMSAAVQVRLEV